MAAKREPALTTKSCTGRRRATNCSAPFDLDTRWDDSFQATRRIVLNAAVDVILVRGPGKGPTDERVHILRRGERPDDLPRRARPAGRSAATSRS